MSDYTQFVPPLQVDSRDVDPVLLLWQHELPVLATSSHPLQKSFAGLPGVFDPDTEEDLVGKKVALLITNKYEDMMWPGFSGSEGEMTLLGAIEDQRHARKFLGKINPEIEVKQADEALRQDIQDQIGKYVDSSLSLLVAYFQGHGQITDNAARYITGDRKKDSLEGLTAEELIDMFSRFSAQTTLVAITDFCHSGNVYRLQFQLAVIDGTGYWYETKEWVHDNNNKFSRKNRIISPMLHIAGSLEWQQAYETRMRGGYFTNSLAHLEGESMTLSLFLLRLRKRVNSHLEDAFTHATNPLPRSSTQFPQIFSNRMWSLDDPQVLSKIFLGTTESFCSV